MQAEEESHPGDHEGQQRVDSGHHRIDWWRGLDHFGWRDLLPGGYKGRAGHDHGDQQPLKRATTDEDHP